MNLPLFTGGKTIHPEWCRSRPGSGMFQVMGIYADDPHVILDVSGGPTSFFSGLGRQLYVFSITVDGQNHALKRMMSIPWFF